MYQSYKGHEIEISTTEMVPDRWDLYIEISWIENGIPSLKTCTIMRWFKTCEDAIAYGLLLVKNWIDKNKPTFRPKTQQGVSERD